MYLLKKIRPEQPLKNLWWFDIGIITLIMFGQFIVRSPQMYMASLSPTIYTTISETETNTASEGVAYSSQLTGYSPSLSYYLSLEKSFCL